MKHVGSLKSIASYAVLSLLLVSSSAFAATTDPFIATLARNAKVSEEQAVEMSQNVFSTLQSELEAGRPVLIRKFGRFYVQSRDARQGRNPRTGSAISIPAKRYPRFASADGLKDAMNVDVAASSEIGDSEKAPAEEKTADASVQKVDKKIAKKSS